MTLAYLILLLLVLCIFIFCYFTATWVWIKVKKNKNNEENIKNITKENRRDFIYLSTLTVGGIGVASMIWPFLKSMNPAEDTLALGTVEIDISNIEVGQSITTKWRGKPIFIRRRTPEEIKEAKEVEIANLKDPVLDIDRVQKEEWLVLEGICTHLGCVPLGQKMTDTKGDYNGWFCPCHGSHYDTSGRIRKGPAPDNLKVPPYTFITKTIIKIG
ncbi:MAG: Ubiquinol-cytochrome c reductase iron-sulfur subunit [Alphaproteobacteria bacterium MarineAlpha5_Bin9]|nr:MAG: Ubiquinol-cytochrome c reductase iron-sulfur subunit [Alphaproteobacteria bacterium MarineAlpha5_Bin9]|tara:strand:- start:3680 stop:4324 length:645 start_codon:yes stop_codon:yes gene_type:complete